MTFPAQIFRIPQKCYHQAQWKTKPQGKTIERREPRQRHNNVRVARWEAKTYFDIILDSSWELHIREPWNNSGKNKSRGQIIKPVLNIGLCYGNIRTNVSLYINIFLHAVLLMSMYDSTTWLCVPSMQHIFFWTLLQMCGLTQTCFWAVQAVILTSGLGFCSDMHCQLLDLLSRCACLSRP